MRRARRRFRRAARRTLEAEGGVETFAGFGGGAVEGILRAGRMQGDFYGKPPF